MYDRGIINMITFPKIKAVSYAIGKRLQGYHLLQNPKGAPQTEVNMMKNSYAVSFLWDDMFETTRIKKTFTDSGSTKQKKYMYSTHYFDVNKSQMTKPRKKDILYLVENDGKHTNTKKRTDIPWETVDKRKELKLSFKKSYFLSYDSEYDKMCYSKMSAERNRGYYKQEYSTGQKIYALGFHKKMFYPKDNRPNFFKVLYKNLTNKG